jgi:hypothetical protein
MGSEQTRPPDPVVEAYKQDVDRTLFDRTLALSPEDRIRQLQAFVKLQFDLQQAARAKHENRL